MFSDRLSELMSSLELSAKELSVSSGFDKSNLSRFVNGVRTPKYSGSAVDRIVGGIVGFCEHQDKTRLLCSIISSDHKDNTDLLKTDLRTWLFSESGDSGQGRHDPIQTDFFGAKLGAVMELVGISNKYLSSRLEIDPSYISRYRNGLRLPKATDRTTNTMCHVLFDLVSEQSKLSHLCKIMGKVPSSEDSSDMFAHFRAWLLNLDPDNDIDAVYTLIDSLGSSLNDSGLKVFTSRDIPTIDINEDKRIYFGMVGLKSALLRLLCRAYELSSESLLIYSDQEMSWVMSDEGFVRDCASLLYRCTSENGMRVSIIHDTDNDLVRTFSSLRTWMPLYIAGSISSYRSPVEKGGRFTASIFLCPGIGCITGSNIRGTDLDTYVYRYDTCPDVLTSYEVQYKDMLESCSPLITVHDIDSITHLDTLIAQDLCVVINTLPFSTMPRSVLDSLLARSVLPLKEKKRLVEFWHVINYLMLQSLNSGCIVEQYFPLADVQDVLDGKVITDTPGSVLHYNYAEYREHLDNILMLTEHFDNFRIYLLPGSRHLNVNITVFPEYADICRGDSYSRVLSLANKRMLEAFRGYIGLIKAQCMQNRGDTKELIKNFGTHK